MAFGRYPDRELCEISKASSDLRLVIESGSAPENELKRRIKVWRLKREETEDGIGPKKLLSERSRIVRLLS